ncbi:unnamed protein product [Symbiodinium natans]|uniref:Uncharacterized protein n=1 Tax=Symbiodinium natans TaxID=878477 RepID=A0A812JZW3_9DINO|nr:unnamed protein product [Symbiodinium natans]
MLFSSSTDPDYQALDPVAASRLHQHHMTLRVESIYYVLESQWMLSPHSDRTQINKDIADKRLLWSNKAPKQLEKAAKKAFTEDGCILLREVHQVLSLLHTCHLTVQDEAFLRLIQLYYLDSISTASISIWAYLRVHSSETIRRHVHTRAPWMNRPKEWIDKFLVPILLRLRDDFHVAFSRPQTKDLYIQYGALDKLGRQHLQQQMLPRLGRAILQEHGHIFGEILSMPISTPTAD